MRYFFNFTFSVVTFFATFAGLSLPANADMYPNHTQTLSFQGPATFEADAVNPFTDYRLLVTFRQGKQSIIVRGFYAADGNAAHTSSANGNVWQVRFAPPTAGAWTWKADFRRGADIAISDDANAGKVIPLEKNEGMFHVKPLAQQPESTRDLRKMTGRLRVDKHYYRFGTDGPFVLKVGANSPENLLAYKDFGGTYRIKPNDREGEAKATSEIHQYKPHLRDWKKGDPTWGNGKGKSLVGAMNYLASTGMNSVYFLTMNIGGDGKDVWPYASPDDFTRFDCSKLDQWEILFEHMQRKGLILHVITQETENETLLDNGDVGRLRKLYYRELIARFAHHPGLIWNLGEENGPAPFSPNGQSTSQQKAMADYISAHDPYNHPILIHTHASKEHQESVLEPLLGHPTVSGIAHQISQRHHVYEWIADWRARSIKAGHPWAVSMDEIGKPDRGALPDSVDPDHLELRSEVLWGSLLSGASGVEWYFGYKHPHTDLTCEDWRSRDALWKQTRIAARFFQNHLPFWEMMPADELITGGKSYCFAKHGQTYAVYRFADQTDAKLKLDLKKVAGEFSVRWFNPRSGGQLQTGSLASVSGGSIADLGTPPSDYQLDWVVLIERDQEVQSNSKTESRFQLGGDWIRLGKSGTRHHFVSPDGGRFYGLGLNHISALSQKVEDNDPIRGAAAWQKYWARTLKPQFDDWNLTTLGYGAPVELRSKAPWFASIGIAPIEKHRSDPKSDSKYGYRFPDVFDPVWEKNVTARIRKLSEPLRNDKMLIGYFWTDTPTWDLQKTRALRGTEWVSTIRNLPPESPGRTAYTKFLQKRYAKRLGDLNEYYGLELSSLDEIATAKLDKIAIGRHMVQKDDDAFLSIIANQFYRVVGSAQRKADPNHLVFGDRYLAGDAPVSVLKAATPWIDAVAVQPGDRYSPLYPDSTAFPAEEIETLHRVTGKPVLICDHAISFPTPQQPQTIFEQMPDETSAAEATKKFLAESFARPYVIGYLRCQYIDRPARFGRGLRQGLLKSDGHPRHTIVDAYRNGFKSATNLLRSGKIP